MWLLWNCLYTDLCLQHGHLLLQLSDHSVPLLDHHAWVLKLNDKNKVCVRKWCRQAQITSKSDSACVYLFNHLPQFSLLTLKHIIQVVNLLFQNSILLFQLVWPATTSNYSLEITKLRNITKKVFCSSPVPPCLALLSVFPELQELRFSGHQLLSESGALLLHPAHETPQVFDLLILLLFGLLDSLQIVSLLG